MNRIRLFFAILFLLALLPAWRLLDVVAFSWPSAMIFGFFLAVVCLVCLCFPLKLLWPRGPNILIFGILSLALAIGWLSAPLSESNTNDPQARHCGWATFTGALHPFKFIMTNAAQDDLDLRNQLCWTRKLIREVPMNFASDRELLDYHERLEHMLLKPELKYRASLPLVAVLIGNVFSTIESSSPFAQALKGKKFIESVQVWSERYNEEISSRRYSWWDWPYSTWIQFEYGFVERHWQSIVNSVEVR